jgi:hypothetical protein
VFCRLLYLIEHYRERGKDFNLESQLKAHTSFMKMNDMHEVQKEIIRFEKLDSFVSGDIRREFIKMRGHLSIGKKTYEKELSFIGHHLMARK